MTTSSDNPRLFRTHRMESEFASKILVRALNTIRDDRPKTRRRTLFPKEINHDHMRLQEHLHTHASFSEIGKPKGNSVIQDVLALAARPEVISFGGGLPALKLPARCE